MTRLYDSTRKSRDLFSVCQNVGGCLDAVRWIYWRLYYTIGYETDVEMSLVVEAVMMNIMMMTGVMLFYQVQVNKIESLWY